MYCFICISLIFRIIYCFICKLLQAPRYLLLTAATDATARPAMNTEEEEEEEALSHSLCSSSSSSSYDSSLDFGASPRRLPGKPAAEGKLLYLRPKMVVRVQAWGVSILFNHADPARPSTKLLLFW